MILRSFLFQPIFLISAPKKKIKKKERTKRQGDICDVFNVKAS